MYFVPELLKSNKRWNVWKDNKEPYNLVNGKKGGQTTKELCVDYETANFAFNNSDYKGVGYCLFREDNITCIDLDSCIDENGAISDFAAEILELFPDTYIELSQSETGLHIFCIGTSPDTVNNQSVGIEIYSEKHFIAFTGNAWNVSELSEHQAEIDELFKRYKAESTRLNTVSADNIPTSSPRAHQSPVKAHIGDLNTRIDKTLDLISKSDWSPNYELLHAGKWNEATDRNGNCFGSPSEADQAFISKLAYYSNFDYEVVKAIFRGSKAYTRDKTYKHPNRYTKSESELDRLLKKMFDKAELPEDKICLKPKYSYQKRKQRGVTDYKDKPRRKRF